MSVDFSTVHISFVTEFFTVKGEQVCLKRRTQTGPQPANCAIGFRSDDEKFYALRDTDPQYKNVSMSGARKKISGTLWPSLSDEYVNAGTIEVRKAVVIDDPKVLAGQYACLPRSTQQRAKPKDCTMGIKTRGGFYWAFYTLGPGVREQLSTLKPGESIVVEGAVGTYVNEEGWISLWRNHPEIEGALTVRSVKRNGSR